jgi:uncharacterized repeat protein (TIGR01451 family)
LLTSGGPTNNLDPNGIWSLFVVDDAAGDVGSISGGWSVTLTVTGSGAVSTDLGVSTIVTPNQTTVGQEINYTISVTNYGPAKATGISLSDVLDPATVFVRAQGAYTQSNGLVTVSIPDLASGTGTNVVITARANPANPAITNTYFNVATIHANETDLNSANDTAIGKVIVYPFPQVAMIRKAGQVVLSWPAFGGTNYVIEASDSLVPTNWTRVTNSVPTVSAGVMSITVNPAKPKQFFRIRTP